MPRYSEGGGQYTRPDQEIEDLDSAAISRLLNLQYYNAPSDLTGQTLADLGWSYYRMPDAGNSDTGKQRQDLRLHEPDGRMATSPITGDSGFGEVLGDTVRIGGGAVLNYVSGGAYGGLDAATNSPDWDYGDAITGAAKGYATGSALSYLNGMDPYGYGSSVGGQAGTAATTNGLASAARGDTFEQQQRNAAISGGTSYAGGTAREYAANTDMSDAPRGVDPNASNQSTGKGSYYDSYSNNMGAFAGGAANLGLNTLWEDPNATGNLYSNYLNNYKNVNYNDTGNTLGTFESLSNTPEGMQALAIWESQQQEAASKKVKAGGSGQYGTSDPQIQQQEGLGDYLYE
jgi:hypothetical protein